MSYNLNKTQKDQIVILAQYYFITSGQKKMVMLLVRIPNISYLKCYKYIFYVTERLTQVKKIHRRNNK